MAPFGRMRTFSRQLCIYILALLLGYKYDDILLSCCDKQHCYMQILLVAAKYADVDGITLERQLYCSYN